MCYQCTEQFVNIETLPVFEELPVEAKRNHGYEVTDAGLASVHRPTFDESSSHRDARKVHTHEHNGRRHSHGTAEHRRRDHSHDGGGDRGGHGHRSPDRKDSPRISFDGDGRYVPHEVTPIDVETRFERVEIDGLADLLEAARTVLDKGRAIYTTAHGNVREAGARPGAGYDMDAGEYDRALMVVESNYDHRVSAALAEAIREKGTSVDIVSVEKVTGEIDAWEDELPGIRRGKPDGHPLLRTTGVRWWEDHAEESDDYDLLIYGVGGPPRQLDGTDYERIPWRTEEDLASPGTYFPTPVWNLINEKTADVVREAEEVRLTDPEGTDLTFTNYNHQHTNRGVPGHIFGHPTYLTQRADTEGVVAGTMNHAGAYPRIEVTVEGGKVVDVRGGGRFGQLWREMLEETEHIQYPGLPGEGLFWLWEMGIGTNPKVSRPVVEEITRVQYPEMERRRSGIIHCGFGCYYDIEPWAAEIKDVPWGHVHVHLNFPTYEATMPDGETVTLIDDGRLRTLDDPEVREKAAEFGDPDELLREDWIPAVPGISVEGSYNGYAKDPVSWISETMAQRVADEG